METMQSTKIETLPLQSELDAENAEFWNELCGSGLARMLGITEHSPESLKRYDQAYLELYPYLSQYVPKDDLRGKDLLEIGLGYGTLGQVLASTGCRYNGLDIASSPVRIMRYRLSLIGEKDVQQRVRQGSALQLPYSDNTFDYVYSIGCLHHTGSLPRAVSELYRVLAPAGKAIIMLYNRYSLRRVLAFPKMVLKRMLLRCSGVPVQGSLAQAIRALYDVNQQGDAAPHTDYVSRAEARRLFSCFRETHIESQNCHSVSLLRGRLIIPRERLLNTVGRTVGTDLYIEALK
jgi:ubiquinone/menaquinone biosynthesis C-methylase UbiE